jgi:hypothetical protein
MRELWFMTKAMVLSVFLWVFNRSRVISIDLRTILYETSRKLKLKYIFLGGLIICFTPPSAHAVLLYDWVFNIDGTVYDSYYYDPIPATGSLDNDLGTLSLEITDAGTHNVIGYFDYEVDQNTNSYYNEYGLATGTPGAGQSWEIDEPGWVFGDLIDNVYAGGLDNGNGVPSGSEEDVSLAIGWSFSLLPGDVAVIDYVITDLLPAEGFYLAQVDAYSEAVFYFSSNLSIETSGGPPGPAASPVPEPGTGVLLLAGLLLLRRNRRRTALRKSF